MEQQSEPVTTTTTEWRIHYTGGANKYKSLAREAVVADYADWIKKMGFPVTHVEEVTITTITTTKPWQQSNS